MPLPYWADCCVLWEVQAPKYPSGVPKSAENTFKRACAQQCMQRRSEHTRDANSIQPRASPTLALGVKPRPPTKPAHRSLMMSPYKFGMTSTSNCAGFLTSCMQALSTMTSSYWMSGYFSFTAAGEKTSVSHLYAHYGCLLVECCRSVQCSQHKQATFADIHSSA